MVSIGLQSDEKSWTHKCVGTIITSNAILTSSKCLEFEGNKTIKAGAENLESPEAGRYVETYEVSQNFASLATNDLAVVYTTKNMHFNNKTQAICLPKKATNYNPEGIYASFQQEGTDSRYTSNTDCNKSWSGLNLTCCSKVCVKLEQYQFYPKDSGAPLIQEERGDKSVDYFEVNGILADLNEDNGKNPGVFAYVKHPDNFEFIRSKSTKS